MHTITGNSPDELEITFLGTGTSQGVPMIGCTCEVCESNDPLNKRTRSSIFVHAPEKRWVIDTGPDFRAQVLRERIHWLDAVVYTHSHTDHVAGFDDLRRYCEFLQGAIPVHASRETMEDLRRMFHFAFTGENLFAGYIQPAPCVIEGPFCIGKTELVPVQVLHGRAHVFGYLFRRDGAKRAAYLSDCKLVPPEAMEMLRGVPVLIVDALRHAPHPTHMTVAEALALGRELGVGETWFTHICHELPHAETEAMLPPGVRMAYDGLKIRV